MPNIPFADEFQEIDAQKVYQQFEELQFWSPDQAEGAAQQAQELVQLADQETATLMNTYEDWKF